MVSATPGENDRFVWPPRELVDPGVADPAVGDEASGAGATPSGSRVLRWIREIEESWLKPTRLPLARRMQAADWSPDVPAAYCDVCGRDVGMYEAGEMGCSGCRQRRLPWSRLVRLGRYEDPLDRWVQEVKFERGWRLGEALGRLLGEEALRAGFGDVGEALIVPMPMTRRRRLARGIDHASAIARGVAWATHARVASALARRHAPTQRAVAPSARASNVAGVFRLRAGAARRVRGRAMLLVDDVTTTGATLRGAARTLRRAGAGTIWVGVIAATPDR